MAMMLIAKYLGRPEIDGRAKDDGPPPEQVALFRWVEGWAFTRDEDEKPAVVANDTGVPIAIGARILVATNPEHAGDASKPPWRIMAIGC